MGTELVHPMGNVTSRKAPNGVWNVVRSLDDSASRRSSYPTYKSRIPPHARPLKCSARESAAGGQPKCAMVTALSGSKLCTILKDTPSFFVTVNQRDWYDKLDGSYVPALIFVAIKSQTFSYIPGGMGIFFNTHGVCSTTGMSTGGKKSVRKFPLSVSSQAKASFCCINTWCTSFLSSGQRKSPSCALSISSQPCE